MRFERVCGYVTGEIEQQYNKSGKLFAKFDVRVNDEDYKPIYYGVLVPEEMVPFCIEIEKSARVTVEGPVELNNWTGKDGKTRSKPIMRAHAVTLADGTSCSSSPTTQAPAAQPREAEHLYRQMLQEPPRWCSAAWWASPGGQAFFATPQGRALYDQVQQQQVPEFTEALIDPQDVRQFLQTM